MESLDSISRVSIHAGSLPGLPSSNGASLVVLSRRLAETNVGLHWVAKSDDEEEHLLRFAKCLVQAISKRYNSGGWSGSTGVNDKAKQGRGTIPD